MTTETTTLLNEVDLDAVGALVNAISADPAQARTSWTSRVRWTGGFAAEAQVRTFAPIASDEPKGLGGADAAPNPVEQLLSALGNCLAVGYAANATLAGIALRELRIAVRGDIDLRVFLGLAQGYAGFESITATVTIDSDADAEQLAALHARVRASSPVGHSLRAPVHLEIVTA